MIKKDNQGVPATAQQAEDPASSMRWCRWILAQWVKDPVLPQMQGRLQLWLRFDPWTENVHIPQVWQKKKKTNTED